MGLAYHSPRQTMDIDLTAALAPRNDSDERVRKLLDDKFPHAATALGYADLIVKTHSRGRSLFLTIDNTVVVREIQVSATLYS